MSSGALCAKLGIPAGIPYGAYGSRHVPGVSLQISL
jgi:hypothetical protein